jgi:hypothetical protein
VVASRLESGRENVWANPTNGARKQEGRPRGAGWGIRPAGFSLDASIVSPGSVPPLFSQHPRSQTRSRGCNIASTIRRPIASGVASAMGRKGMEALLEYEEMRRLIQTIWAAWVALWVPGLFDGSGAPRV